MKKIFLISAMLLSIFTTSLSKNTYQGTGTGLAGKTVVDVIIEENSIVDIQVVKSDDTSEISERAFELMKKNIIETQSMKVDTVAGATYASKGFKEAVAAAVAASGIQLEKKPPKDKVKKTQTVNTDIVVIGGGGAGLSAAIQACELGSKVILVEKMPLVGGNTILATGGLNATGTLQQKEAGIEDSAELFFQDTMKGGKNKNNKSLVRTLVEKSKETVAWLTGIGADLKDVGRLGGASVDRAHRPSGGGAVGSNIVTTLSKRAEDVGVDIRTLTRAVEILTDEEGRVSGIEVQGKNGIYTIDAKAVIVATGGFGNNQKMISKLRPDLKEFGSTNHPGSTGDAFGLVDKFNVDLVDMAEIQTHPTVVPSKRIMITEAVRGNGAILLNKNGKRFINELSTRDVVSSAILDQKNGTAYLIFDQKIRESLKSIEKYIQMNLITKASTLDELAEKTDINAKNLKKNISRYNSYVENGKDKKFSRPDIQVKIQKAPFYAVEVGPAIHHTMGGIKINKNAEVINISGNIVKGLYAAGEVTGGVHGGNRLGGNSLADITTFGRIAGRNAHKYADHKK